MISLKRFMKIGSVIVGLMVNVFITSSAAHPLNLYGRHAEGKNGVVAAAKPEVSQIGVEVLQKGYMYKDKVIRPVMVKVSE